MNNDAGRTVTLLPDKGRPEGFVIQPSKPLEITLIDLSTDGRSVAPVEFNATDSETGLPLLINNMNQPVPITPIESQADYTDIVITVPGRFLGIFTVHHTCLLVFTIPRPCHYLSYRFCLLE